jgi:hypothetical protein
MQHTVLYLTSSRLLQSRAMHKLNLLLQAAGAAPLLPLCRCC